MSKVSLKEYQAAHGIKRIDFDLVKPTGLEERYAENKLICPYCGSDIDYESEDTQELLNGTNYECPECGKYFRVESDITINSCCTPMEDWVREDWVRREIENAYKHDDECNAQGLQLDLRRTYGVVEWEIYKDYAEPIFHNMELSAEEGER